MRTITTLDKPAATKVTDLLVGDVVATKVGKDGRPMHLRAVEAITVGDRKVTLSLATPRKAEPTGTADMDLGAKVLVVGDVIARGKADATPKAAPKVRSKGTAVRKALAKADAEAPQAPKAPAVRTPKAPTPPKATGTLVDRIAARLEVRIAEIVDSALDQAIDQAITKALG